ncbi:MAG: very short patch repair endonuclease [Anaerolineales bacterium]|nr:very short patch repair endonuclease [Anaerolineales bacterium]
MDKYSREKRSEIMSSVKSVGTSLENYFCSALEKGEILGFKRNYKDIFGHPDFVFEKEKIVIFIDSCFWHGCSSHLRMPSSRQDYWIAKISHNRKRDKVVTKELRKEGWKVIRIWEHSIKNPRMFKWWISRIKNLVSLG